MKLKYRTMNFGKYILILSAVISGLSGCIRDKFTEGPDIPAGYRQLTLSMEVPRTTAAVTRAVPDESFVDKLDVMIYKYDGYSGDNTAFVQHVQLSGAQIDNSKAYKTFRVNVPVSRSDTYCFLLLANLRDEVNALDIASNYTATKTELLADLKYKIGASGFEGDYLPMWGEAENFYTVDASSSIPTIQMIRSVARIDLSVDGTIASMLKLRSLKVAYQHPEGLAAPLAANYSPSMRKVTGVSLCSSTLVGPRDYPLVDESQATPAYIAEYGADNAREFCMIIHAEYVPTGQAGWYKVFVRDNNGKRVDLLRNHRYEVTITGVTGPGFPTYPDALDSSVYLQAEVAEWNEARQSVVMEGGHYLDVTHPVLGLYAEEGWVDVTFKTNYPGAGDKNGTGNNFLPGVSWKWVTQPSWISTGIISHGTYAKTVRLAWTAATESRGAAIRVTAGNMNYILNITQCADSWLTALPVHAPLDGMYHQVDVTSDLDWTSSAYGTAEAMSLYTPVSSASSENRTNVYFRTAHEPSLTGIWEVKLTFTNSEYHYTPVISLVTLGNDQGI